MKKLLDSYINDYTIFEATLRRDFLEVNGILTEAQDELFIEQAGDAIINIIFNFKNNISKISDGYLKFITDFKKNKWDKRWAKEKSIWEKADLTGLKLSNPVYIPNDDEILRLLKYMRKAVDFNFQTLMTDMAISVDDYKTDNPIKILDNMTNEANDRYKNHKAYFKSCHDNIWYYMTTEPFKTMKKETVIKNIDNDVKNTKFVIELKNKIDKNLSNLSKAFSAGKLKTKPESKQLYAKAAKFLNAYRRDSLMVMNSIIKEAKALFKNHLYIYNVAIAYAKKHSVSESVDSDYINAVAEADIYEMEL